ncbi:MAG: hypothetical protein HDR13_13805 [Lachnospiraceae bacterium]|nr:hypothetical protein [Lachnospiraceae bacterium]
MEIINSGNKLLKFKSKIVIYGGGGYGRFLYELGRGYINVDDLLVCDQNINVCRKFPRYISIAELNGFIHTYPNAVIIIAIQNEEIVKKVYSEMIDIGWKEDKIYRFMPQTKEEWMQEKLERGFFNGKKNVLISRAHEANKLMQDFIRGNDPFFYSRWGTTEGNIIYRNKIGILEKLDCEGGQTYSGIFPPTDSVIKKYINITEEAAREIDVLCAGFWCRQVEELFRIYSPEAKLVGCGQELGEWSSALKAMRVLVVHPFSSLIEKQYQKRDKLYQNPELLPAFELKTYKAVQSLGGNEEYDSWIEALSQMKEDICKIDFDIALLGCGAYGMPLGAFIKHDLHKKALHIGGALQLFFGVKGKRWDNLGIYNEFWVRPTDDLKPQNYKIVEDGCYW